MSTHLNNQTPDHNCGDCGVCPAHPKSDQVSPGDEQPTSGRIVVTALVMFAPPLVLAMIGVLIAGQDQATQLLGALVGLALGMAGASCAVRLWHKYHGERGHG